MRCVLRASAAMFIALALSACGPASEAAPSAELSIEVHGVPDAADLGKAFSLTIIRRWTRDHEALPFDAAHLQPVAFEVRSIERTAFQGHWRETITGDAWIFSINPVTAWSVGFEARTVAGASRRAVRSEPHSIRVLRARAASDGFDAELPSAMHLISPPPLVTGISGLVVASAMWAFWLLRRHGKRRPHGPLKPAPRARLAALNSAEPQSPVEWDRWHVELSGALRDHIEERHAVAAPRMTTEELARDPEAQTRCGIAHDGSVTLLRECDAVKFAANTVHAEDATSRLAAARRLVEEDHP